MQYGIDPLKSFFETSGLNFTLAEVEIRRNAELNLLNFNVIQKSDFGDEQMQYRIFYSQLIIWTLGTSLLEIDSAL